MSVQIEKAASASAGESASPVVEATKSWLTKVNDVQSKRLTPEARATMLAKAERSRQILSMQVESSVYQKRSNTAFKGMSEVLRETAKYSPAPPSMSFGGPMRGGGFGAFDRTAPSPAESGADEAVWEGLSAMATNSSASVRRMKTSKTPVMRSMATPKSAPVHAQHTLLLTGAGAEAEAGKEAVTTTKTQIDCKFYLSGVCNRGEKCKFLHPEGKGGCIERGTSPFYTNPNPMAVTTVAVAEAAESEDEEGDLEDAADVLEVQEQLQQQQQLLLFSPSPAPRVQSRGAAVSGMPRAEEDEDEDDLEEVAPVVEAEALANAADFHILLQQLRVEPTDAAELKAKFVIFETYLETVVTLRNQVLDLWTRGKKEMLAANVSIAQVDREIAKIDGTDNMGVPDAPAGEWLVYAMMKQASQNHASLSSILRSIETKLGLLARDDCECPMCLESLAELVAGGDTTVKILSCCHKVCAECWAHWVALKQQAHSDPYCPTCRNVEFVSDVNYMATPLPDH